MQQAASPVTGKCLTNCNGKLHLPLTSSEELAMHTMTLTAKGQFTINKSLMEHLGVKGGEKILVKKTADGGLKIEAEKKQGNVMDFAGFFKTDIHLTDDEINECIAAAYVEAGMRGLEE
jgi:bifunctional DNA-binding transcriptional regulator/antitoxin component of YhaV-PrlF toxin-antitoxin module